MRCCTCKLDKDQSDFCKDKNSKTGFGPRCKSCYSQKAKVWYSKNQKRQLDLAREPYQRFLYAKKSAKVRGYAWEIEQETFYDLIKQPCYYCNKQPEYTTGVGLDRLDNNLGYILTNVQPCCGRCNIGRNANFSPEEWKVMIDAYLKMASPTGIEPVSGD